MLFSISLFFSSMRKWWSYSWTCWTRNLLNVLISLLYSYWFAVCSHKFKKATLLIHSMLVEYLNLPVETIIERNKIWAQKITISIKFLWACFIFHNPLIFHPWKTVLSHFYARCTIIWKGTESRHQYIKAYITFLQNYSNFS